MRKTLAIASATLFLALTPGISSQVQASDWLFGTGFRIGGFHFRIGYGSHGHRHGGYYYRASKPIHYRGYSCGRACYRHQSHYYHHRSCPVVTHHFHRHGYDDAAVFATYSPHADGHRYYDRGSRYYDRDHRYNDDYRGRSYRRSCDRRRY